MAIAAPTNEYRHLRVSQYLEEAITSELLAELWGAFYSPESSVRRISSAAFADAIKRVVTASLSSDVIAQYFSHDHIMEYFQSMDVHSTGWVEWVLFEAQLSHAATLRKYPTELERRSEIQSVKMVVPGGLRAIWIPQWRRTVLCYNSSSPRLLTADGALVAQLDGHISCVTNAVYLSPIGALMTFGCDRVVALWDHRKATPPLKQLQLSVPATSACYDTARNRIWIASSDGYLMAYDATLETLLIPKSASKHTDWIHDMLYLEELTILVTCSLDRTVAFWDTTLGTIVATKSGHSRGVRQLAYMKHARLLFSSGQGKEVCVWNPFSMASTPAHVLYGHEREIVGIMPDVCNKCLVTVDVSARLVVWDVQRFVRLQVLDLGPQLADRYHLFAAIQNPMTREISLFSPSHMYKVATSLTASRVPKLGHRVKWLLSSLEAKMFVVGNSSGIHLFDMIEGTFLKSVERPFGAVAKISFAGLLTPKLLLLQSDGGRANSYVLSGARPLPETVTVPFPFPLRFPPGGASRPLVAAHSWTETIFNKAFQRCMFVFLDGNYGHQSFLLHEFLADSNPNRSFQACPQPRPSLHMLPMLNPSTTTVLSTAFNNTRRQCCVTNSAREVFVWTVSGTDAASSGGVVKLMAPHGGFGPASSSAALQPLFLESRNALLILRPDGFYVMNCGSWTMLIDYRYDLLPQDLMELPCRDDVAAAALLPPDASGFSLLSASQLDHETIVCATDYMGKVLCIDMAAVFSYFFSQQQATIVASTDEIAVDDEPSRRASVPALSKASPSLAMLQHFVVTRPAVSSSQTSVIDIAIDKRTQEHVLMKHHTSFCRFQREVASRRDVVPTYLSPWTIRTIAIIEVDQGKPTVSSDETSKRSQRKKGDSDDDDDDDEPIKKNSIDKPIPQNQTTEDGDEEGATRKPGVIVMESGEEALKDLILKPGERISERLLGLSQSEKDFIVVCLVSILERIESAGYASMDLRPRSFHKVGDIWKLGSLDSLVTAGTPFKDPISAAYCPPEMAAIMADRAGVGKGTVTKPSTNVAPRATVAANLWMIAVIAYELQLQRRLFVPDSFLANASLMMSLGSSEQFLFDTLDSLRTMASVDIGSNPNFKKLSALLALIPDGCAAAIVVRRGLRVVPEDRGTAAQLREELAASGFSVDPSTLFCKPSCLRTGSQNSLPDRVARSAVAVTIGASEHVADVALAPPCQLLPHCTSIVAVDALPGVHPQSGGAFAVCDRDPSKNGEGALHLYTADGSHFGFLPPPEFGHDSSCAWRWPSESDVQHRNESVKSMASEEKAPEAPARPAAAHGGPPTTGSDDEHDDPLQPPVGWQSMTLRELKHAMGGEDRSQSPLMTVSVEEAVERFITTTVRRAPFYKGGQREGDPMPTYAEMFKAPKGGKNKQSTSPERVDVKEIAKQEQQKDSAFTKRKWAKYWEKVGEEMGMPHGASTTSTKGVAKSGLTPAFTRSVPKLSTDPDDEMNRHIEELFDTRMLDDTVGLSASMHMFTRTQAAELDELSVRRSRKRKEVEDAKRRELSFTDNNLSSMSFDERCVSQQLATHMQTEIESDLRAAQERSIRRERARQESLRKRGLPLSSASVPSPSPK